MKMSLLFRWVLSEFIRQKYPVLPLRLIDDIGKRISKDTVVFEYGCGYSTIFFSRRCKVYSVEDNLYWYKKINVPSVFLAEDRDSYVHAVDRCLEDIDILYVDGSYRLDCLKYAFSRVKKGLVILDDANRDENHDTLELDSKYPFKIYGGLRMNSAGFNSKGYFETNYTKVWSVG